MESETALDAVPSAAGGPGLGASYREARLRRGLTIAEAASDTRINPDYLEALERDRWELMPAPVYARGFARGYARYLGLPLETVDALAPRNLPRPRELEPAAGLRRRAAGEPLSFPALPALRLPTLALPTRSRRAGGTRERAPATSPLRAATSPRGERATLAPLAARARIAAGRLRGASSGRVRAPSLEGWRRAAPRLEGWRRTVPHLDPRFLALGAGALATVLVVALMLTRLDGGGTDLPEATSPSAPGGRVAGPEPSTDPAGNAPPAFRPGEMPDLAGMTRREAEATLTRLGLTFVVIETANASAPPGTVYNHSPQAGKSVKRGDAVTLLVARAP